jgi:hypothetical protein
MDMNDEEIGPWIQEKPDYPHEIEQWRNTETGGVIVVEEVEEPDYEEIRYEALELPPSKEVKDHTDVHAVAKATAKNVAREEARERMAEDIRDGAE